MSTADLKDLSEQDLLEKLEEVNTKLDDFYKLPKEKIEKPRQKSILRHERARIITLLNQKK